MDDDWEDYLEWIGHMIGVTPIIEAFEDEEEVEEPE